MDEQMRLDAQTSQLHILYKQNAHLLSVLCQIRDSISPSLAITGANLDAANYALTYVFGPRGNEYGRFCADGEHEWHTPLPMPGHILAPLCIKCGKLDLQNPVKTEPAE